MLLACPIPEGERKKKKSKTRSIKRRKAAVSGVGSCKVLCERRGFDCGSDGDGGGAFKNDVLRARTRFVADCVFPSPFCFHSSPSLRGCFNAPLCSRKKKNTQTKKNAKERQTRRDEYNQCRVCVLFVSFEEPCPVCFPICLSFPNHPPFEISQNRKKHDSR